MPPKAGGKKAKKAKRGGSTAESRRDLVFREDEQEYAQVMKVLGDGRMECYCFDAKTRQCRIRGRDRRRAWVNLGDIVLISKRDFGDDKADIIWRYTPEEAMKLKIAGEIPESVGINATATDLAGGEGGLTGAEDTGFDFEQI